MTQGIRSRELGNIRKVSVLGEPGTQSPLTLAIAVNKKSKSRYQAFLVPSNFTAFLYFFPNIVFRIVGLTSMVYKFFDKKSRHTTRTGTRIIFDD